MKFEKLSPDPEARKATFEVVEPIDFTEHAVAVCALGLLTVKYADSETKRLPPAKLGTEIQASVNKTMSDVAKDKKDGPVPPQAITHKLTLEEAGVLHEALNELIDSAPQEIVRLACNQSSHAGSVRSVESNIAQRMQEELEESFSLPERGPQAPPVGFR